MENSKNQTVKFYDDEIPCLVTEEGKVFVPVRAIALAIGLNPDKVVVAIKNDEILGQLLLLRYVVAADSKERLMQLLPIEYLHGWLFSIDIGKVNEAVRPKLQLYKRECFQVLYDHFNGKYRQLENTIGRQYEIQRELKEQERIKAAAEGEIKRLRKELEQLQLNNYNQLGLFAAPRAAALPPAQDVEAA